MNDILREIYHIGIVPVIAIKDAKDAKPLAKALCEGGLSCAEVTFRTAAAEEAIRIMTSEYPQMLVGAGTVLTTEQADRATAAGAKFIVSPGLNPKVVRHCVEKNIPIVPGCTNPSDIEQAMECGLEVVKFFPAEAAGGLDMIKAMSAPYGNMKFLPTGGINEKNLVEYLDFKKVIACGGSWMVKSELIAAGEFEQIKTLTQEAVNNMLGFEIRHVGINAVDDVAAGNIAETFSTMFHMKKRDTATSVFVGNAFEVMKSPYLGAYGHIAIQTNSTDRAFYYFTKAGYEFNMDTATYDEDGRLKVVYFKEEVGGFALHLAQK